MTIWLLAVVLLASEVGLGLRQGAIRAGCSFVGIVLGTLLATPLGHLLRPALGAIGIKHPLVQWLLPPFLVFVILLILFKIAGYAVHHKVEMFYKYKAGDLRLALWERLNSRLGMCIAIVNGVAYLVLISFVLYIASYWSVQLATSATNPKALKLLNRLGKDLQATGMAGAAISIDRMPSIFYETADLAGLIYNNPDLKDRLYDYPPFIAMAEQPEYDGLVNSAQLAQSWQSQAPILTLLKSPAVDPILKNPDSLKSFWSLVEPDLNDLAAYLATGQSPKYHSEQILGRWDFDVNGTIGLLRRARPNIPSKEMAQLKNWIAMQFAKTTLVVMPNHESILKNYPHVKMAQGTAPSTELENVPGRWSNSDGKYALTYRPEGKTEEANVEIEGDRLTIAGQGLELAFDRED